MQVFNHGLTYCGAVLELFIIKVVLRQQFVKSQSEKHHLSQVEYGSSQRPERCQFITADVLSIVFVCYSVWETASVFVFMLSPISPDYEIQRQIDVLQRGGSVQNETRAYNSKSG